MFSDTIPYLELYHRGSIMGDVPKTDLVNVVVDHFEEKRQGRSRQIGD